LRLFKTFPLLDYHTIVDLGAYGGEFTDGVKHIGKPKRVVLIEAYTRSAAKLKSKFASQDSIQVVHAAIRDRNCPLILRINTHRGSNSLLRITETASKTFGKEMREVETVKVPGQTLDSLFEEQNLDQVALLKVDLQGAEHQMIAGG
jgi:FkbM family methyltransferase